jgi:tRNA (guanine-N7-)-methyltransferase
MNLKCLDSKGFKPITQVLMKPKNLKAPLAWEERRPLIHDRILFVPQHYDRHLEWTFPGWESPEIFGRVAPIEIEYCTGNGAWIIEKARAHPERNWVAVEKQFDRVRKIWSKMHNFSLSNLFIVCGEALTFTRFYVPDRSFEAVYINFPDPWPKGRHAKNRLLREPFISEMARVSVLGATAIIVTDHVTYTSQICEVMSANPSWNSRFSSPHYVTEWVDYGTSFFDSLWREQDLKIHYMQYSNDEVR